MYVPYAHGFAQDCNISSANALEILQSCAKPSLFSWPCASAHSLEHPCFALVLPWLFGSLQFGIDPIMATKITLGCILQCCLQTLPCFSDQVNIHYFEISSIMESRVFSKQLDMPVMSVRNVLDDSRPKHDDLSRWLPVEDLSVVACQVSCR